VAAVLREFPGLEHRLEFVREKDGVTYINDSKGTNVGAVVKSVEGFMPPVILIAGGLDKGSDFGLLHDLFKKKVKLLILIGQAAGKMARTLGTATETVFAKTLQDAVMLASERARSGEVVLLSPACASFDMFRDFEDRGGSSRRRLRACRQGAKTQCGENILLAPSSMRYAQCSSPKMECRLQNVMDHKGRYDRTLLVSILSLIVVSVVMVYSSSSVVALTTYDDPAFFMKRQILWAIIGLALMAITMHMDHGRFMTSASPSDSRWLP
jgi:hypothetical protein